MFREESSSMHHKTCIEDTKHILPKFTLNVKLGIVMNTNT